MLTELEIKEEPLEDSEILQQQQETIFHHTRQNQQALWSKQIQTQFLKDQEMHESMSEDQFHIVEEHEDFITVSAADMKTQDELQFIQQLQNPQISCNKQVDFCFKSPQPWKKMPRFAPPKVYFDRQKCCTCPLIFRNATSLLNHLKLHRENYFFCIKNCGASFRTLPLCEDHERNVHKLNNLPKIRYKHFCSFCRTGFKTELQLHVHWLQKQSVCFNIRLNVVIHSNQIDNSNNSKSLQTASTTKNATNPLGTQVSTTNACSNFPITKLRLKSVIQSSEKVKRRQSVISTQSDDLGKRIRFVDNPQDKMTQSPEEMLMNLNTEIEIKNEPIEEDILNTTPPFLMPEVILKTEEDIKEEPMENNPMEEDQEEDNTSKVYPIEENTLKEYPVEDSSITTNEMKSLLINNNKTLNPDFMGKITPLIPHQTSNTIPPLQLLTPKTISQNNNNNNNNIKNKNNICMINTNTSLKNITNLKPLRFVPASIASSALRPCNLQVRTHTAETDGAFNTTPKDIPLQLVKILPSTQYVSFVTSPSNGVSNAISNESVLIKLQPLQILEAQQNGSTSNITPTPMAAKDCNTSVISACPNQNVAVPTKGVVKLNEMLANNTIDSEDFKKLQSEAFRKAEELRKNYISKESLSAIDNLPEKKQLIANLKQQMAEAVNGSVTKTPNVTPNALFKKAAEAITLNTKNVNEPPTLYLPILTTIDVDLEESRCQHPNYIYKWICPYCLKGYGVKRSLKSHLIKAHNLTNRDLEKINTQAKPFLNTEVVNQPEVTEEPEHILPDSIASDSDSTQISMSNHQETQTAMTSLLPEPIKMSALKAKKAPYICHKCDRKCSSKTMLRDHLLANCSREPQYACKECSKKFYSESTLRCHVTIHTGELPHKCNYCDKRFRTRGQVTVHHRTHTGERPFVCQVCVQRFTHRETLIAHLSRHIGMKRYKCYCCDKHFSCISALKTHREIRPTTCGKVKFNPRALGPRVRVVRGNVIFEAQPEINPYLKSEDPQTILADLQNQPEDDADDDN